jgi:hypothetical protein
MDASLFESTDSAQAPSYQLPWFMVSGCCRFLSGTSNRSLYPPRFVDGKDHPQRGPAVVHVAQRLAIFFHGLDPVAGDQRRDRYRQDKTLISLSRQKIGLLSINMGGALQGEQEKNQLCCEPMTLFWGLTRVQPANGCTYL